jgi:hypothetical protein
MVAKNYFVDYWENFFYKMVFLIYPNGMYHDVFGK